MKNKLKINKLDMKEKIHQLLIDDSFDKKESALNLLFLKYKMVCDIEDVDSVDYMSYFCIDICFDKEIEKLVDYYNIAINCENPFTHEVVKSLESDYLIDISSDNNNKGSVKIMVPNGVKYLREKYKSKNSTDIELTNMVVYNTVNNITIHIGDTITNITQGMSKENKEEFIELLKDYSKDKDKESFIKKLGTFSGRVGEGVFIRVIANILNPTNLSTILTHIVF